MTVQVVLIEEEAERPLATIEIDSLASLPQAGDTVSFQDQNGDEAYMVETRGFLYGDGGKLTDLAIFVTRTSDLEE